MHAVTMESYGGPSVLSPGERREPAGQPGWVSVKVQASALNWHDTLVRRGIYASPLPHVPGADGAGIRTDTGDDVIILPSLFWGPRQSAPAEGFGILGDRVQGTYAEYASVPAECLLPRPRGLSLPEAASLSLVGVTVFRALFTRGRLAAGESLLVLGASGGIATAAVAQATAVGAHVVVTSTSAEKLAAARELGAADGLDHGAPDWTEAARAASPGGAGFDVVLDSAGRWAESVKCLRPGGRCVVLGASAASTSTLTMREFYFGQFELIGTTMGSPQDMAGLLALMAERNVRPPVIDRTYPLDEAAAAHERLESGAGFGKIVLLHQ